MHNGKQRTILVIGEWEHDVLLGLLNAKRLRIEHVPSAHEAVQRIGENAYSVVLFASAGPACAPVLDALDLIGDSAPIVLVIGGTASALSHRLNANRIHGIIREPFDAEDIAEIVQACAELRHGHDDAIASADDVAASLPC